MGNQARGKKRLLDQPSPRASAVSEASLEVSSSSALVVLCSPAGCSCTGQPWSHCRLQAVLMRHKSWSLRSLPSGGDKQVKDFEGSKGTN